MVYVYLLNFMFLHIVYLHSLKMSFDYFQKILDYYLYNNEVILTYLQLNDFVMDINI